MSDYSLGIDIGGTFTDLVVHDQNPDFFADGSIAIDLAAAGRAVAGLAGELGIAPEAAA
ncbi:MAG TPA: hypothetical protein VHW66_20455 [Stellaceae bacterium]|nr:hypothetical protein [Stellaceae bacterium]